MSYGRLSYMKNNMENRKIQFSLKSPRKSICITIWNCFWRLKKTKFENKSRLPQFSFKPYSSDLWYTYDVPRMFSISEFRFGFFIKFYIDWLVLFIYLFIHYLFIYIYLFIGWLFVGFVMVVMNIFLSVFAFL